MEKDSEQSTAAPGSLDPVVRRLCPTHPTVNYKTEWGCPECTRELRDLSHKLMRVCYDEANRIANHCSDGAAKWAMQNLYDAANEAKRKLSPNSELTR